MRDGANLGSYGPSKNGPMIKRFLNTPSNPLPLPGCPSLSSGGLGSRCRQRRLVLLFLCCLVARMPVSSWGQSQDLSIDRGAAGLAQALARLPLTSRVLFIAAHPDDEPAGLLTFFSRGLHARTALLTLTRGEGGQNLISSDLTEALGLLRTGELLAADEYYGVEQYFTRAFDFGFSRSPEETFRFWDREIVLGDMVRVIRRFRPDIIVSVWKGTVQDGHGHHQASGILAREAYRAAGDPTRFPEQKLEGLAPWQTRRYCVVNSSEGPSSLKINTGEYVPLFGSSFQEIGALGYSLHRTQGMGTSHAFAGDALQVLGELSFDALRGIAASSAGARTLFSLSHQASSLSRAGLGNTVYGLPELLGTANPQQSWLKDQLESLQSFIDEAQSGFSPNDFSATYRPLLRGLETVRQIRQALTRPSLTGVPADHLNFLMEDKERDFLHAIERALGLSFEALSEVPVVTQDQRFVVTVHIVNRSLASIKLRQVRLLYPPGWKSEKVQGELTPLNPGAGVTMQFVVTVAREQPPTQLSLRRDHPHAAMYTVTEVERGQDSLPGPPIQAQLEYSVSEPVPVDRSGAATRKTPTPVEFSSVSLSSTRPVEYLDLDRLKGTRHIPLLVLPPLFVNVAPPLQVIPLASSAQPHWVQAELVNNSSVKIEGLLRLKIPAGWSVQPGIQRFQLAEKGLSTAFKFRVFSSGKVLPGHVPLTVTAEVAGRESSTSCRVISAFDLWRIPLYQKAGSELVCLDVRVAENANLGYIMGAGDKVPQVLEQLGVPVTLLGKEELASGDLSHYSCIVAGIRAYDVRSDLIAFNSRLLKYVEDGGTYIVQYNTPGAWNRVQYSPYPARIVSAEDRVTDETAPVTILDAAHPMFHSPNRITPADFDGWVQERGLYFIQDRDPRFKALLSSHDPTYPPLDGGLLLAQYGRGLYVLTSYSWFRQLPASVPGAIRLFANLISLSAKKHA